MQLLLQVEQLLPLALHHFADRDTRPTRYDIGNIIAIDLLLDHGCCPLHGLQSLLQRGDLLLLLLDLTITDLGYLSIVTLSFRFVGLKLQVLNVDLVDLLFLALPFRLLLGLLLFQVGDFLVQLRQFFRVILPLDGLTLNLQLLDSARDLIQRFWNAIHLHTQTSGCLIHQVDRLIR